MSFPSICLLAFCAACPEPSPSVQSPQESPQDPSPAVQAPSAHASAPRDVAPTTGDRQERHGITWQFDRDVTVGTFCNGDPWVVGPVRIVAITPACTVVDGRTLHGATVDPDASQLRHGYDSLLFGQWSTEHYDARCNAALAIARGEPLRLQPGQSLVSVISNVRPADGAPQLKVAAVLTVVASEPSAGAFRPPYCKTDAAQKKVRHREADLDYGALARLRPVAGMPATAEVAAKFEKLWLDHAPSWIGRFQHPIDAMPDYGRDLAVDVGSAALLLNTALPDEQKRLLLIRCVQLGIDTHACLRSGCRWPGNGGHGSGRKFPILLAGAVLKDDAMLAVGRDFPSARAGRGGPGTAFFGEDSQTFVVAETAPGEWNWGHGGYGKEHAGLAEWGFAHTENPEKDDASWDGNPYRRCCTATAWVGSCLAARAMGLVQAWHHDAFFAYVDRYLLTERRPEWRAAAAWHAAMWDQERGKY